MCIYVYLENASSGDNDQFNWYYEGELYNEGEPYLFFEPGDLCHGSCYAIQNTSRVYMTGLWSVEVYLNGVLRMSEGFYLQGLPQTTTTSSSSTTTTTTPSPCPMSLIYGERSMETDALRSFRDKILSNTQEGRELIKLYYLWSPIIVKAMEGEEEFKEEIKQMIDGVLPMIGKEVE